MEAKQNVFALCCSYMAIFIGSTVYSGMAVIFFTVNALRVFGNSIRLRSEKGENQSWPTSKLST